MKRIGRLHGSRRFAQKVFAQLIANKPAGSEERFAPRGRAFVSHADLKALVKLSGIHINHDAQAKDTPSTGQSLGRVRQASLKSTALASVLWTTAERTRLNFS